MKRANKTKPFRRAEGWIRRVPALSRRVLAVLLIATALGMLFSGLASVANLLVRRVLAGGLVVALLALFAGEGAGAGTGDAAESRRIGEKERAGGVPTGEELAACYQPSKALAALLLVFALPLALSVYVALSAEPYAYTLQDLPSWLSAGYASREDVLLPLAAYQAPAAPGARVFLRLIVRLPQMAFLHLVRDAERSAFWLDRLSPLFYLAYMACFFGGYLAGPARWRKREAAERKSKRIAARRASKSNLAQALTRGGGEVHYGQRQEAEKNAKKLI